MSRNFLQEETCTERLRSPEFMPSVVLNNGGWEFCVWRGCGTWSWQRCLSRLWSKTWVKVTGQLVAEESVGVTIGTFSHSTVICYSPDLLICPWMVGQLIYELLPGACSFTSFLRQMKHYHCSRNYIHLSLFTICKSFILLSHIFFYFHLGPLSNICLSKSRLTCVHLLPVAPCPATSRSLLLLPTLSKEGSRHKTSPVHVL